MSKTVEQKALEEYPMNEYEFDKAKKSDIERKRFAYIKGYDQAFQDIKEFIYDKFNIHPHDCHVVQYNSDTPLESMDDFIKQIENYIKDEL